MALDHPPVPPRRIGEVIPLFDEAESPIPGQPSTTAAKLRVPRANNEKIQADRQARLFEEFAAIHATDAWTANSAGFLPSALVQASLPYRDPGNIDVFVKTNGKVSLMISPGFEMVEEPVTLKNGTQTTKPKARSKGFPYGSIPRLVLSWVATQAILTKRREVQMGNSLSNFMSLLGSHNVSGGETGSIKRLKDQTGRLLACHMSLVPHKLAGDMSTITKNIQIASFSAIYDSDASKRTLDDVFGSKITLSEEFIRELLANPVPLDFRALRYLRQSPMALDIYAWLTWSFFSVRRETLISWDVLYGQFGGTGSNEKKFKENWRQCLEAVKQIYPAAQVVCVREGALLSPSPTHVPVRQEIFAVR